MFIDVNTYQVSVYYNIYLINIVFFRCRVVSIAKAQEVELRKMHEIILLIKIEWSRNFPRNALCSRKSALVIGLHKLNTTIEAMKLKLCVENEKRIENSGCLIKAHKEH